MKALKLSFLYFLLSWTLGYAILLPCFYLTEAAGGSFLDIWQSAIGVGIVSFGLSLPLAPAILAVFAVCRPWAFPKTYQPVFFAGFGLILSFAWLLLLTDNLFQKNYEEAALMLPFVISTTIVGTATPYTKWFAGITKLPY